MITVDEISYTAIREQPELLAEYAEECRYSPIGEVNPQWEMYERMELGGIMQAFTVSVDGLVVGFAVVLMMVLPHYGVKAATVETLFVAKAWRRTMASARLMAALEKRAKNDGCKVAIYSARTDGELEAMLEKRSARRRDAKNAARRARYAARKARVDRTNSVFCKTLS